MTNMIYPIPHSHKTFQFDKVIIDSNFDSGNLYNAEKNGHNNYNLWVAVDHIKNQYKSWFHFSAKGLKKQSIVTFNMMNFGNQSKLLNQGLVPVFRQENNKQWKRIIHKVTNIEVNQGWTEWVFKHTVTTQDKTYFAFFYPWSNTQNNQFLQNIQIKCKSNNSIYFKRSNIINSLQGRPVQFITITSTKGITNKNQKFQDEYLFPMKDQPRQFLSDKKVFIIGARVHPGQVPSSHVMTGIITQLTQNNQNATLLRDKFIFYLFPIINPDGVARGHYRVDPNGINLNRCYINPSPKNHSPIYAIKKIIMHFHNKNKYFGFLDLHAHASRKGVFIYGNSIDQLQKQVQICMFPKILSLNSQIFQYQGSNFKQQNMYIKDLHDHVSKQGAGRVALFKMTKNPYSWTLQCNYNMSRVTNIIQNKRQQSVKPIKIDQNSLDQQLIVNYRTPNLKEGKQFYTIKHFRQLGKQICDSLLDLIQMNPQSRIDNPKNYYKSIQNLKLNLAVALLRMAPTRFQSNYKRIYQCIQGPSTTKQLTKRAISALYLLLIKKAKINNINTYLKDNDDSVVQFPIIKTSHSKKLSLSPVKNTYNIQPHRTRQNNSKNNQFSPSISSKLYIQLDKQQILQKQQQFTNILKLSKVFNQQNQQNSSEQNQNHKEFNKSQRAQSKRQTLSSKINKKADLQCKNDDLLYKNDSKTLNAISFNDNKMVNGMSFSDTKVVNGMYFNDNKLIHAISNDNKTLNAISNDNKTLNGISNDNKTLNGMSSQQFMKNHFKIKNNFNKIFQKPQIDCQLLTIRKSLHNTQFKRLSSLSINNNIKYYKSNIQQLPLLNYKTKGISVLNSIVSSIKTSPKKNKNKADLLVLNND